MAILAILASLGASFGWACGIVIAQKPASALGAFEFTRIQLLTSGAILAAICAQAGLWSSIAWNYWPAFAFSIFASVILGNLAMIECLRRGGPRRTELLVALKAPIVAIIAYFWLGETLGPMDMIGGAIVLSGVVLAILYGNGRRAAADPVTGSLIWVILLGATSATFQGLGLLTIKPAMLAGTDPLAASALRIAGAAFVISLIGLWPAKATRPKTELTPKLLFATILPGFIGYGIATSLLLYAFANFHAGIAAVLGSLSPIIVLPIIWLKTGHPPHPIAWIGAATSIAGTAMIVLV